MNKKVVVAIIFAVSLLICAFASADSSCGANATWTLDNGTLTISGSGPMYQCRNMKEVPWYEKKDQIIKAVVEEGITSISNYAFYDNKNLLYAEIAGSVESIGRGAFDGCVSLSDLIIHEGVRTIADDAFASCTSLCGVSLPSSLIELTNNPFEYCTSIKSFSVSKDNNVYKTIDGVLFSADGSTLVSYPVGKVGDEYVIPEGVKTVGEDAFNKSNLMKIVCPKTLEYIGDYAFSYCSKLTDIDINEGIISIGSSAFYECSSLITIDIPASCLTISSGPFNYNSDLSVVRFYGKDTMMKGDKVFKSCSEYLIVYGLPGSVIEQYCQRNNMTFRVLEETNIASGNDDTETWTCINGHEGKTGKFCNECGSEKPSNLACTACLYKIPEGFNFYYCPMCGTALKADK